MGREWAEIRQQANGRAGEGLEAPARWSGVIAPRHTFQKASVEAASDLSRALRRVRAPTPSHTTNP